MSTTLLFLPAAGLGAVGVGAAVVAAAGVVAAGAGVDAAVVAAGVGAAVVAAGVAAAVVAAGVCACCCVGVHKLHSTAPSSRTARGDDFCSRGHQGSMVKHVMNRIIVTGTATW